MIDAIGKKRIEDEYVSTFTGFKTGTKEEIREKLSEYKKVDMNRFIITNVGKTFGKAMDCDDEYFALMENVVEVCRELDLKFLIQDGIPFPTGAAGGAFALPDNKHLNKIYIDERHCDTTGPMKDVYIRTEDLLRSVYVNALHTFNGVDFEGRKKIVTVAYRMLEGSILDDSSAIILDEYEKDGFLHWDVPEGHWRIFVLFTTYESNGRPNYMNLLSRDSVRLEMEKVHIPIYEHLKEELGKTWLGFFYDEPEIGNNGGNTDFDFQMLPGRRQNDVKNAEVYPWSPEMPGELELRDPDWKKHLPYIFYDGITRHAAFRVTYLDAVSALVRVNYGGQIHEFCREHGIVYVGHVLEDENSHARLGCGPGHYFRQQYYQDQTGIDVIAGQLRPGCDQNVAWYGVPNANGELYYYGIAKLASSEARINPIKKNQCIVENLAAFGTTASPKYKKFLTDHLVINGLNHIILSDTNLRGEPEAFVRETNDYTSRMCQLSSKTDYVIKTAVLYHAEMEWAGKTEMFHKPASVLAQNQISYDVIPTDVFAHPEWYDTETDNGLVINGNRYEALIIPGCEYLPDAVYDFIEKAKQNGFPVFFENFAPNKTVPSLRQIDLNDFVVSKEKLAENVRSVIRTDVEMENAYWVRYAHLEDQNGTAYLFHNEAPIEEYAGLVKVQMQSPVYRINLVSGVAEKVPVLEEKDGFCTLRLHLEQFEMIMLYHGTEMPEEIFQPMMTVPYTGKYRLSVPGHIEKEQEIEILDNIYHLVGPEHHGKIVYRFQETFAAFRPKYINLGKVFENAIVYVNGEEAGFVLSAPYQVDISKQVRLGENEFLIEVYDSTVNYPAGMYLGMSSRAFTGVAQTIMEPAGLLGPISFRYGVALLPEIVDELEEGKWYRVTPKDCVGAFDAPVYGTMKKGAEDKLIVCFCGGGVAWDEYMAARPFSENSRVEEGGYYADDNTGTIDLLSFIGLGSNLPENPFCNWSMIVIPYCTGDFHTGTGELLITDLDGKDRVVHFHGYTNYRAIVEKAKHYLNCTPDTLMVTGFSAGAFATSMLTDDVMDLFPEAKKTYSVPDSALMMHPNWGNIAEKVWKSPKAIAERIKTEDIVLDSLSALKKKRGDRVQILYICSIRDGALASYVGGKGIHRNKHATREMCDRFQLELKQFMNGLQAIDPTAGFYFFDAPDMTYTKSEACGTQHTILLSPSAYTIQVEGKTVITWLHEAVDGEVTNVGIGLLNNRP